MNEKPATTDTPGDNRTPDKTIGQIEYAQEPAKPEPMKEPQKPHGDKFKTG